MDQCLWREVEKLIFCFFCSCFLAFTTGVGHVCEDTPAGFDGSVLVMASFIHVC
jgi:hypothetical protein